MERTHVVQRHEPWNKGKLVGQKAPFKLREIWAIRVRLQMQGRLRELAMFNLRVDSKLRACDLVSLRVRDVSHGERVAARAIVYAAEDAAPGAVRDHAADARSSGGMDQAGRADVRRVPVFEPGPRIATPWHAAVRATRRRLGGGNWSRPRGVWDAFDSPNEAHPDLPANEEP